MTTPDAIESASLALPERVQLDPISAVALALRDALAPMIEGDPDAWVIDMNALAAAALIAITDMPRIPSWNGPRTIGGAARGAGPEPELRVTVKGGTLRMRVTLRVDSDGTAENPGHDIAQEATLAPADVRAWALAALAGCLAAEANGPYLIVGDDDDPYLIVGDDDDPYLIVGDDDDGGIDRS